jgi:hypothetical protein
MAAALGRRGNPFLLFLSGLLPIPSLPLLSSRRSLYHRPASPAIAASGGGVASEPLLRSVASYTSGAQRRTGPRRSSTADAVGSGHYLSPARLLPPRGESVKRKVTGAENGAFAFSPPRGKRKGAKRRRGKVCTVGCIRPKDFFKPAAQTPRTRRSGVERPCMPRIPPFAAPADGGHHGGNGRGGGDDGGKAIFIRKRTPPI